MGLLSRFKHSPASSSKQSQPTNDVTSTPPSNARPTTPTSKTHLSPNLDTPSTSKLVRPTIPPPSPSSNSITSKLANPFKKQKGKEKEKEIDNPIKGTPYESHSHSHLSTPTRPQQARIVSAPNSPLSSNRKLPPNKQRRSTLLSFDSPLPPQPISPLATTNPLSASTSSAVHLPSSSQQDKYERGEEEHIRDHNHDYDYDIASSSRRKDRVTSGQFRQVGGILGQLNFEVDLKSDTPRQSPPEKWLGRSSNPPVPVPTIITSSNRNEAQQNIDVSGGDGGRGMTPSMTDESIVIIDKDDVHPDITQDTSMDYSSINSPLDHEHEDEENRMELLESAEKKTKFWKRQRRSSKTQVDSEVERSNSPTPRRNSRNDTSLDLTNNRPSLDANQPEPRQPRPQQLRRPSSSFFHNPFTRSVSRTSLALDDNPKPDDGSFQLRGFRHVSGMMEVEGAGELENYLAHVRKEPRSSISSGDLLTSPIIGNNDIPSPSALVSTAGRIPSPPVSYAGTPRQPPTFPLSRPASIANSLGSATGDEFISATKVSVAAFRKGMRRPSETLVTMSDSGHGVPTSRNVSGQHSNLQRDIGDDDDDDDLPLGMIRGKDMRRENSSQSLSSMRGTGSPSGAVGGRPATMFDQIDRPTSPAIAAKVKKEGSASPAMLQRQLSPEVVDRKNTPSPFATDKRPSPSPSPNPSSSDITRRGSPALGQAQDIPRKPSPNPGLSFTVHRQRQGGGHTRNGGGSGGSGFVVKSTRLTRDDLLPKNGNTPTTSGPSTPNPQQSDSTDANTEGEGGDFVASPEELDPIDGYFSHLAPLIHDHPAASAAPLPRQPSPSRAPGPPVGPLPLPQVDDATPKSLVLPLPPDQMPDTPPKQSSDLPQTHTSPRAENRKKLSLLEEPMKIISGLWTSAPTDDGFDPAFVLSSMDAYGGDEQQSSGREMNHQPNSHPTSTKVQPTASGSDAEERIRSPLSERLAGIASSSSTNNLSRPSLSQIKTQDDGYSTEKVRSPMSDSTISPATTTTVPPPHSASADKTTSHPVPPKETIKSSFARARKPSNKFEDTDESDDESDDGTVESSSTTPQSKTKVRAGKRNSVERKVPHGPRKPSVNNRNRNRKRVSSMFDTTSTSASVKPNENDDRPIGMGRKTIGKSPSVSNMPRSTSALGISGGTESRRDIGAVGQRPKTLIELGPIVQPLKDRSGNHPTSPVAPSRPNISSTDTRSSSYGNSGTSQQRRYSSNGSDERKKPTTAIKRSPAQTLIKLPPGSDVEEKCKTASPDSSRSATTGGSVNYQPLTPKESEGRRLGREVMPGKPGIGAGAGVGGSKQLTYPDPSSQVNTDSNSKNAATHNRQRSYSSMGQNQPQSQPNQWNMNMNMNMGYDQNQMGMMGQMPQMGMGMGMGMQGMDPEAIRNMMKQQWQMQFMAAAYRASEEEWERASCVSGQTNQTVPASFGQASGGYGQQPFAPMQQMGWMGQYPNPMGMGGYGYPQGMFPNPNQPFGFPMPPQSPGPGFGSSSQGGMYSYGTSGGGAQSVFGGEFGPPPITPSQRFMNNSLQHQQPPPPLPANSQQEIARNTRGRHNSSNQYQSVYIPSNLSSGVNASPTLPPPSSWGRRTGSGSGDWSDLPSQGQRGKARPQTQFIN